MNNYSRSSFFRQIFLFLFLFPALGLSVSAQFAGAGFVAKNFIDDSRPRVVTTAKEPLAAGKKAAFSTPDLEKQAFDLLNSQRAAKSLPALAWNDDVARIARLHSENMAKYKFFSHTGLDGSMVNDRADLCGVSKWRAIGENIAFNRGYAKPAEFAVDRWMRSTAHRENILNDRWTESGVGVALAEDGSIYFTQVFLLRK